MLVAALFIYLYMNINRYLLMNGQQPVVNMLTFSFALHLNDIDVLIWTSVCLPQANIRMADDGSACKTIMSESKDLHK